MILDPVRQNLTARQDVIDIRMPQGGNQKLSKCFLEFPAPKKLTTRNVVRDKQTIPSPFIELTN